MSVYPNHIIHTEYYFIWKPKWKSENRCVIKNEAAGFPKMLVLLLFLNTEPCPEDKWEVLNVKIPNVNNLMQDMIPYVQLKTAPRTCNKEKYCTRKDSVGFNDTKIYS